MFNYFLDCVKNKYIDFKGRARRSEFWYFVLGQIVVLFIAAVIDNILGTNYKVENAAFPGGELSLPYGYIYFAVGLALFLPSLGATVRRLHDVGKSGWFYLIIFIPFIGAIWILVLLCTDSTPGDNKWGPNPKGIGNKGNADDLINSIGNQ
jgi:uncharacterized membrane protein YhaH (DUF805 family)